MQRSRLARAAIPMSAALVAHLAGARLDAQQPSPSRALSTVFDAYVTSAMRDGKVPGLAIAVVHDDSVIFTKGYGTRTMGRDEPVDEHTIFAIGSTTKAFTSTLVAMMVDAGKMRWDDAATTYLPGFELYDPWVTRELTVRDLLTHRSGLERGDIAWYATDYDRDEVLRRIRFLRPTWSMRSHFGYQNVMYLAAGQAVAHAAGESWDQLVKERILDPLGMSETSTSVRALAGRSNVATPHTEVNDTLRIVPWHQIDNIGPAGSINSNVADMIRWVRFQLARGKVGERTLVSASALGETHTAQQVIPVSADARQLNPYTHLQAYGMGWFLQDYRGRELDQHGGNIDGMTAMVAMVPEARIGLVILSNANGSQVPTIVMYRALDALLGDPPRDWSAKFLEARDKARAKAKEAAQKRLAQRVTGTTPSLPLAKYVGTYADSLYGNATVTEEEGRLVFSYGKSYRGDLEHWHYDTFRATWRDHALGRTFVTFALDADAAVKSVTLEGIGTFGRRPAAADTSRRIALAASEAGRLTGTFVSRTPALTIEVRLVDGELKLTVPGQPVYTLLADTPTRFRLTGPPGMPAGFYLEYTVAGGEVRSVQLIQPSPRSSLTFQPR